MRNSRSFLIAGVALFLTVLAVSTFWMQEQYLLSGFVLVIVSVLPFLIRFEVRKPEAREVVLVAVLAAIAAVGRIPFASLPGVQPTSFIIILTAAVFGSETGFLVGAAAAIVSNIFLGQGPWTPWQIFAWGFMGLTAGFFKLNYRFNKRWLLVVFGFVWGFIFGWIMDLWFIIGFVNPITWKTALGAFAASFYFDLAHAVTNAVFIWVFSNRWMKIMQRIKLKYGILN